MSVSVHGSCHFKTITMGTSIRMKSSTSLEISTMTVESIVSPPQCNQQSACHFRPSTSWEKFYWLEEPCIPRDLSSEHMESLPLPSPLNSMPLKTVSWGQLYQLEVLYIKGDLNSDCGESLPQCHQWLAWTELIKPVPTQLLINQLLTQFLDRIPVNWLLICLLTLTMPSSDFEEIHGCPYTDS